jgi:hypothetical protein
MSSSKRGLVVVVIQTYWLQQIPRAPHHIPRTPHQIPRTPLERAADE